MYAIRSYYGRYMIRAEQTVYIDLRVTHDGIDCRRQQPYGRDDAKIGNTFTGRLEDGFGNRRGSRLKPNSYNFV